MKKNIARRLARLRSRLRRLKLDAMLITNGVNVRYLSGFTGDSSVLLITAAKSFLITDFRYIEQAAEECRGFEVVKEPGHKPVKAWTRGVLFDEKAKQQVLNVARMPFVHGWVAVMPDVHWGMGATIGSVIPTHKAIIPAAVGVDIGCGMMAVQTSLAANDLPDDLAPMRRAIERAVPHGRTHSGGRGDRGAWSDVPGAVASSWAGLRERFERIAYAFADSVSLERCLGEAEGPFDTTGPEVDITDLAGRIRTLIAVRPLYFADLTDRFEQEGFKAVSQVSGEGVKTNMTLNFSAMQALMAAKVGATYISPFVGRLDNINEDGMQLVSDIRTIYDNYGYDTKIIVAAVRTPKHVLDSALVGADVVTMRFNIMNMLYDHPMTDIGLKRFLEDWEKVPKSK